MIKDFFEIPQAIARRMDTANKNALKRIGEDIARIGSLNNYKDAQLIAVKMSGESVEEITRELSKASGLTESDIEALYADAARYDYEFAEQFYLDREQVPFEENKSLQRTVKAMTKAAQDNCYNLSHSYAFALRDRDGKVRYTSLRAGYKEAIDKAITAVKMGTTDYKAEMRHVLKQYADSGIRVVDWESGYSQRIDTAVRRNIMDGLRQLKNETQKQLGEEFGADGYEISAHANPAPDHADIQGRQYSFEEFEKLNDRLDRKIGTLNCYHTVTAIILGISRPVYTEEQLQEMNRKSNNEKIDIDGKKYTRYECTQLQRQIETKIRKLKDRKEILKAAGDDVGVRECNRKIRLLKEKYNEITLKAGLDTHYDRMSVVKSGKAASSATRNTFKSTYYNPNYKYEIHLNGFSEDVNCGLSKAAHDVAKLGSETQKEHLNLVNLKNGNIEYTEVGDYGSVGYSRLWEHLKTHPNNSYAFVHNHNNDTFLSETDMRTLLTNKQISVMIAVRNDAVIYVAERERMAPKLVVYDSLYQDDLAEINRQSRAGEITIVERAYLTEEIIVNNLLRDYTKGLIEIDGRK